MAFDFKKEFREFYLPPEKPGIVNVPRAKFLAVRGSGDPNEEGGSYPQAIGVLYCVAYTLKMSCRTEYGLDGTDWMVFSDNSAFHWLSVIRLPDFITEKDFAWAVETATKKKKRDCTAAEFLTMEEGLCVQMMHIGPYDKEPATVQQMDAYIREKGYKNDISSERHHHEIYLSDPRKVSPEKWRTVIRHPIRPMQ